MKKVTKTFVKMTEDKWFETYRPIKNPHEKDASFDGYMFETYGKELAQVLVTDPRLVWTYVEVDGNLYIASGFHSVNRLGYFITEQICPDNTDIEILADCATEA